MLLCRRLSMLALAVVLLAACQTTSNAPPERTVAQAVEPQPTAVQPGLGVEYLRITANHVDDVEAAGRGRPGSPLPHLAWKMVEQPVLTSTEKTNVGARIEGLIRLDTAGSYAFRARSNDGIRVFVGGVRVVDDPGVHAGRLSTPFGLHVADPGWYSLYIVYFQKGGTAELELQWRAPGEANWRVVPATALAHVKS